MIKLEPADGIKGKTWGPSTLHQRERPYLQALSQASTQNPTHFSKSAPNLDKSRAAGTDSPTNASTSHNNFLGKSVDGLNVITKTNNNNNNSNKTNNNNSYGNSTKLGSVDQLNNDDRYARHLELCEDDDDDDEDGVRPGCFSFIGRNDDSLLKRKKHSLDSKMADSPNNPSASASSNLNVNSMSPVIALHNAVTTLGAVAYVQEIATDDESHRQNYPDYDRVFYNNIQKSLDCILSNFQPQYPPFEREQFDRECFLVRRDSGNDAESQCENQNDSSFDAGTSTNQELSQKSVDLSLPNESEKSSSQEHIFQDDQLNSSSDTASTSRKSSVTFRDDDDNLQYALFNIPVDDRSAKITGPYAIITHPHWLHSSPNSTQTQSNSSSQSSIVAKKERKEKPAYFNIHRMFRHKKTSKTDMDEQLLDDDTKHYAQA